MGDRFLSSAGTGKNRALPMRVPNPSPVLDKNYAPMGPESLSSTGARVWRKAPKAFLDSDSVLDKFQSAIQGLMRGSFRLIFRVISRCFSPFRFSLFPLHPSNISCSCDDMPKSVV